ncbi:MAG: zinc ABC transporter substrate-binding protein [Marinilabiliales bacterium]|nr:zinc ABC transporter substrate-binding protein [Marinilabiliales bacterium]
MHKRNLLPLLLILSLLASCGQPAARKEDKIIFVSILPLQYFADQISGGLYRSEVMVPPGVGPETYNPTPRQMGNMAKAKAYFANGYLGFEEAYLDKFQSVNPGLLFVNTSEGVDLIHAEADHDGHHHLKGVDPHTWSAPSGARVIARNICKGLSQIDPAHEAQFRDNLQKLLTRIDSVDQVMGTLLNHISSPAFMVFHPALGYLARDYHLEQLSIEFEGKVPTPRHVQQLVEQSKEKKITRIMIQREFDPENAEIIARETGSKVIRIDPLAYNWPEEMISIARKLAGKEE